VHGHYHRRYTDQVGGTRVEGLAADGNPGSAIVLAQPTWGVPVCRSNVPFLAEEAVARLVRDIAQALADEAKVDVSSVRSGPVDFGSPDDHRTTA
jgi:hypothetical protein